MEDYTYWIVNYISCEGNNRWMHVRCPSYWTQYDVEAKAQSLLGGVGDDMAEIENIEESTSTDIFEDWE